MRGWVWDSETRPRPVAIPTTVCFYSFRLQIKYGKFLIIVYVLFIFNYNLLKY